MTESDPEADTNRVEFPHCDKLLTRCSPHNRLLKRGQVLLAALDGRADHRLVLPREWYGGQPDL